MLSVVYQFRRKKYIILKGILIISKLVSLQTARNDFVLGACKQQERMDADTLVHKAESNDHTQHT